MADSRGALQVTVLLALTALLVPVSLASPDVAWSYAVCVSCHGAHGEGRPELGAPRIGDLDAATVQAQLTAFRDGARGAHPVDTHARPMRGITAGMSDQTIAALADFVAQKHPVTLPPPSGAQPSERYASCAGCHGEDALGNADLKAPSLLYQDPSYLTRQLQHFRDGVRGGPGASALASAMAATVAGLTDDQIAELVGHIGSLRPPVPPPERPPVTVDEADGLAAWASIYAVTQSPRCLNCHPSEDAPLQTDDSVPHTMEIARFSPLQGQHCTTCHAPAAAGAGLAPLPPADPLWSMPPASMAFQGRTSAELCAQLQDPASNGGRGLVSLVDHVENDHLLITSWESGRTPPPLSHAELVARFTTWGVNSADEMATFREQVESSGKTRRKVGNADKALQAAAKTVGAVYESPHLVHAPMEPPAAVAWVRGDSAEVWASTQAPQNARKLVARYAGLKEDAVVLHPTLLGGGFGRKSKPDYVAEAAFVSKAIGAPVRLQWCRTDDIQYSYYHAASVQRLDAGFDASGTLTAWRHRLASPTILSTFLPFLKRLSGIELGQGVLDLALTAEDVSVEVHKVTQRVRIGWMRSVYNIDHGFAIQSFVDELAVAQGVSTPEMLKAVIGPPRLLTPDEVGAKIPNYGHDIDDRPVDVGRWHKVIDDVVRSSGYSRAVTGGRAMGFAAHASFGSYVAAVVAVEKDAAGRPRVVEAWTTIDAGQVMNPDRVVAQMEGAVIFGASVALHGEITFRDGAVEQTNYHDYPVLRMNEAPAAIHVSILESDEIPGGVGEPGVPPVAPAIANAWFALTGERVRTLPMRV